MVFARSFQGGFTIAHGLEDVQYLKDFHFTDSDLAYLATLKRDNKPLFEKLFLKYLEEMELVCDLQMQFLRNDSSRMNPYCVFRDANSVSVAGIPHSRMSLISDAVLQNARICIATKGKPVRVADCAAHKGRMAPWLRSSGLCRRMCGNIECSRWKTWDQFEVRWGTVG